MFVTTLIICFFFGIVFTLCVQFVIVRVWFSHQPVLHPPYKQQYGNFQLPKIVVDSFSYLTKTTLGTKVIGSKPDSSGKATQDDRSDSSIVLNVILQFLFAELKDTALVRRWVTKKLNIEFQEMLNSKTGKFVNEIEVRDFNFGTHFPVIQSLQLKHIELSKDADLIQTFELMFDISYEGDFQLTLDVDVIFGAWAYLSIIVKKLYGRARVQFSRVPYTHWSFAFYEEPRLELDVDSRFSGRPIPQISSLIISQIKRTIRKKHVLPAYKIRCEPIFEKPEDAFVKPEIYFHGNKLVRGKLSVKVLRCGRLHDFYKDSKLFCTLSVDKEEIEEVWRQSWLSFEVHLNIPANTYHGLNLQDQISCEKIEKRRVVVAGVSLNSPAGQADIRQGDIIEFISNIRVLSFKHALKQLRNVENVTLQIKRYCRKFSHIEKLIDPDNDAPTLNFDVTDVDNASMGSDYGFQAQELQAGEVSTREVPFSKNPEWNENFEFMCSDNDRFVNVCVWCRTVQTDARGSKQIPSASKVESLTKNSVQQDDLPKYNLTTKLGYTSIPLADIAAVCLIKLQGDTQYTMYLHQPKEPISASHTKIPLSHHSGFDKKISRGDITLSFVHIPFKATGKVERKKIVDHMLNQYPDISKMGVEKNVLLEGQHSFKVAQFPSGTLCKFCGKKIWMKEASHCDMCMMICHKKCVDKCQIQTRCSRDGPKKKAGWSDEPWIIVTKDEKEK